MVIINEWLPNPTGADAAGEWIELWNGGDGTVSIHGWKLTTKEGGAVTLQGEIPGHGYAVLKRADSKLTLRNTDEEISLYDARGALIDQSGFLGSAPEGKSYSRSGDIFSFLTPTPGAPNEIGSALVLEATALPAGQPIEHQLATGEFVALLLGTAVLITGIIFFIVRTNEDLHNLFFGSN